MLQDRVNHLLPERTGAAGEPTLEAELRATIAGEVRFDDGSRALYATDASNYRQVPIGVVIPKSIDDVITTVAACRRRGVPVLPRGGGTSLCGQCCNVAVVIDFTKYLNRIVEIDPQRRIARVLPGVILDDLRDAANAHGLTFAPDPATHNHCSLGGMLGNNSCGPHSVMAGTASDNVVALDVLTYDGERMTLSKHDADADALQRDDGPKARILRELRALGERYAPQIRERYPDIPRRVSGYNIDALLPERFDPARALVGSEGTCVVILEATVRLVPWPNARTLLVLGYPDVYAAGDHVPQIMKAEPIALEGIDDRLVDDMDRLGMHPEKRKLLPEGRGWLLVEFGGDDADEANAKARALMQRLEAQDDAPTMTLCSDPAQQADVWKIRESGLGATAHVPNEPVTWEGWEDSAVPPERLGEYLRALRALLDRYGYGCDLYGHFGQGCVHTRIDFDLQTAEGIAKFRRFIDDAAHLVVNFGGSISGEHGDGQSKASLLPIMFGNELMQAFRDFKRIWDPGNKMNPGKVIDAYEPDENLRLGLDYRPQVLETRLHYLQDGGDFAHTMLRCVGVGECRKKSGTMCPSYMATGEEKHSTRGRARMLWEMVNGNRPDGVLRDGWKEHAVKEALDLCLSCKGCKTECPVSVDMAAYKAEFFSHYYEGRPRPLAAYAFGLIDRWAQLGSVAPQLANLFTQTEPFASIAKAVIGVAPERRITRFAREPFTRWLRRQRPPSSPAPRGDVLLWPDTFTNYFQPRIARAALAVLQHAGWRVRIPRGHVCCGRPLYEFGMLDRARDYLAHAIGTIGEHIRNGTPIVCLEPACVSTFREDLLKLLPFDAHAKRLSRQVLLLDELLEREAPDLEWPRLRRDALVHQHCHQKTVLKSDAQSTLLERLGVDARIPDTGCCGMAGSFGFEAHKYDVSIACGERVLLPAVRRAPRERLIVADGFSCREQIEQTTGRRAMHTAQVLEAALRQ